MTAAWDNSGGGKPRIPDNPPRDVRWGECTLDDMGHAAIPYTFDDDGAKRDERRRAAYQPPKSGTRVLEEGR